MIINPKDLDECDERNNKERLVRNELIMSNARSYLVELNEKINLSAEKISSTT
jgi:hypothetical protein